MSKKQVGATRPNDNKTSVRPSDRRSIQSRVRPTDSPSSLTETQNKYCVDSYDIYSIHNHYKGNHKRGGAAGGRATSFVVARPKAAPPL